MNVFQKAVLRQQQNLDKRAQEIEGDIQASDIAQGTTGTLPNFGEGLSLPETFWGGFSGTVNDAASGLARTAYQALDPNSDWHTQSKLNDTQESLANKLSAQQQISNRLAQLQAQKTNATSYEALRNIQREEDYLRGQQQIHALTPEEVASNQGGVVEDALKKNQEFRNGSYDFWTYRGESARDMFENKRSAQMSAATNAADLAELNRPVNWWDATKVGIKNMDATQAANLFGGTAPFLVGGVPGGVMIFGDAARVYHEGTDYQREHNNEDKSGYAPIKQQFLTRGQEAQAAGSALGYALLNKLEASTALGLLKKGENAFTRAVTNTASKAVSKVPYVGSDLGKGLTGIVGLAAASAGLEGVVEGAQTALEQTAQNRPIDAQEIGESIAGGLIMGGGFAGTGAAAKGIKEADNYAKERAAITNPKSAEEMQKTYDNMVKPLGKDGNPNPNYSPDSFIREYQDNPHFTQEIAANAYKRALKDSEETDSIAKGLEEEYEQLSKKERTPEEEERFQLVKAVKEEARKEADRSKSIFESTENELSRYAKKTNWDISSLVQKPLSETFTDADLQEMTSDEAKSVQERTEALRQQREALKTAPQEERSAIQESIDKLSSGLKETRREFEAKPKDEDFTARELESFTDEDKQTLASIRQNQDKEEAGIELAKFKASKGKATFTEEQLKEFKPQQRDFIKQAEDVLKSEADPEAYRKAYKVLQKAKQGYKANETLKAFEESPRSISRAEIEEALKSPSLTQEQRERLSMARHLKHTKEFLQGRNGTQVNKEIMFGERINGRRSWGIEDYLNNMIDAIAHKDIKRRQEIVSQATKFFNSHKEKLHKFTQAIQEATASNKTIEVKHNNKTYKIHANSGSLINAVKHEVSSLSYMMGALKGKATKPTEEKQQQKPETKTDKGNPYNNPYMWDKLDNWIKLAQQTFKKTTDKPVDLVEDSNRVPYSPWIRKITDSKKRAAAIQFDRNTLSKWWNIHNALDANKDLGIYKNLLTKPATHSIMFGSSFDLNANQDMHNVDLFTRIRLLEGRRVNKNLNGQKYTNQDVVSVWVDTPTNISNHNSTKLEVSRIWDEINAAIKAGAILRIPQLAEKGNAFENLRRNSHEIQRYILSKGYTQVAHGVFALKEANTEPEIEIAEPKKEVKPEVQTKVEPKKETNTQPEVEIDIPTVETKPEVETNIEEYKEKLLSKDKLSLEELTSMAKEVFNKEGKVSILVGGNSSLGSIIKRTDAYSNNSRAELVRQWIHNLLGLSKDTFKPEEAVTLEGNVFTLSIPTKNIPAQEVTQEIEIDVSPKPREKKTLEDVVTPEVNKEVTPKVEADTSLEGIDAVYAHYKGKLKDGLVSEADVNVYSPKATEAITTEPKPQEFKSEVMERKPHTEKALATISDFFKRVITPKSIAFLNAMSGLDNAQDQLNSVNAYINLRNYISASLTDHKGESIIHTRDARINELMGNENFTDALTYSLYSWLNRNSSVGFTTKQLTSMYGFQKGSRVNGEWHKLINEAGHNSAYMFDDLGSTVFKVLDIVPKKNWTEGDYKTLVQHVGMLALHLASNPPEGFQPVLKTTKVNAWEEFKLRAPMMSDESLLKNLEYFGIDLPREVSKFGMLETINSVLTPPKNGLIKTTFVKANTEVDKGTMRGQPLVMDIVVSNRQIKGKSVLTQIFEGTDNDREPALEPEKVKESIKRTFQKVSPEQKKLLGEVAKQEWNLNQSNIEALRKAAEDGSLELLLGLPTEEYIDSLHPDLQEEERALKNQKLDAVEKTLAWAEGQGEDTFYMTPVVWQNYRWGYKSNIFNPQQKLLDRILGGVSSHRVTMPTVGLEELSKKDLDPKDMPLEAHWWMAIAEGAEGIHEKVDINGEYLSSARTTDKVKVNDYLKWLLAYTKTDTYKEGIAEAKKWIQGKPTDYTKIKALLDDFGTDELSIGSVLELARYEMREGNTFTTQISRGSDGINNGVAITSTLQATTTRKRLEAVGLLYSDKSVQQYRSEGNPDVYEETAEDILAIHQEIKKNNEFVRALEEHLNKFNKKFGQRKETKKALIPVNYGSAIKAAVIASSGTVLDQIKEMYYKNYKKPEVREELQNLVRSLQDFLNKSISNISKIPSLKGEERLKAYEENADVLIALNNYMLTVGLNPKSGRVSFDGTNKEITDAIKAYRKQNETELDALDSTWKATIRNAHKLSQNLKDITVTEENTSWHFGRAVDNLSGLVFGLATEKGVTKQYGEFIQHRDMLNATENTAFDLFERVRDAYLESIGKQNWYELTYEEQEEAWKELKQYSPVVDNIMAKGNVDHGIFLTKVQRAADTFKPTTLAMTTRETDKNQSKSYSSNVLVDKLTKPGVRAGALIIQGLDGTVASKVVAAFDAFHAHDSQSFALNKYVEGTLRQNEELYKIFRDYNYNLEVMKAYIRVWKGLKKYVPTDTNVATPLVEVGYKKYTELTKLLKTAVEHDLTKYELLKEMVYVSNYAGEGGQYKITDKEVAELTKRQDETLAQYKAMLAELEEPIEQKPKEEEPTRVTVVIDPSGLGVTVNEGSFKESIKSVLKQSKPTANDLYKAFISATSDNSLLASLQDISFDDIPVKRGDRTYYDRPTNTITLANDWKPKAVARMLAHIVYSRVSAVARANPTKYKRAAEAIRDLHVTAKAFANYFNSNRVDTKIFDAIRKDLDIKDSNESLIRELYDIFNRAMVEDFLVSERFRRMLKHIPVETGEKTLLGKVWNALIKVFSAKPKAENLLKYVANEVATTLELGINRDTNYRELLEEAYRANNSYVHQTVGFGSSLGLDAFMSDVVKQNKSEMDIREVLAIADKHIKDEDDRRVYNFIKDYYSRTTKKLPVDILRGFRNETNERDYERVTSRIKGSLSNHYNPNHIYLETATGSLPATLEIFLHEAVHSITTELGELNKISTDLENNPDAFGVLAEGENIDDYEEYIRNYSDYIHFENAYDQRKELPTVVLTNPIVRAEAKKIKYGNVSLYEAVALATKAAYQNYLTQENDNAIPPWVTEQIPDDLSSFELSNQDIDINLNADPEKVTKAASKTSSKHIWNANAAPPENTKFSPTAIFDALATKEDEHLRTTFSKFINPLLGSVDPVLVTGKELGEVFYQNILDGTAEVTLDAAAAGFELTDAQAYVYEVIVSTLERVTDEIADSPSYRQLRKAYDQAKARVRPEDFHKGDWNQATKEEKDLARTKYNYVFNPPLSSTKKSDFISRFLALGLTNKELGQIFDFVPENQAEGVLGRVEQLFEGVLEFVLDRGAGINGRDTIKQRLNTLSETLAKTYLKNQDLLHEKRGVYDSLVQGLDSLNKTVSSRLNGYRQNKLSKALGAIWQIPTLIRVNVDQFNPHKPIGELREAWNEINGTLQNEENISINDLFNATKSIERQREETAESIDKEVTSLWTKDLTKQDHKAITSVVLRSDLQSLLANHGERTIQEYIFDPNKRQTAIEKLEQKIAASPYGNEYLVRAKMLAYYMQTGIADVGLAKNALAIAERAGIQQTQTTQEMVDAIDQVTTLYSLNYIKQEQIDLMKELNDNNQIIKLAQLHEKYVRLGYAEFDTNPYSENKGYMPSIVNQYKDIIAINPKDEATYERWGYMKIADLKQSPWDNTEPRILMLSNNTGKQRYVSGAFFLNQSARKGSVFADTSDKGKLTKVVNEVKKDTRTKLATPFGLYDPRKQERAATVTYDNNGDIVSVGYEMAHHVQDVYLDRNNDPAKLMAMYSSQLSVKQAMRRQNEDIVDYLKKEYEEAPKSDKNRYVFVGKTAGHKRAQEYWASLPKETKDYIGEDGIWIRNDVLNTLMGFSKINLIDAFRKQAEKDNLMGRVVADFLSTATGQRVTAVAADLLNVWYELIKQLKDFVVIRTGLVLVGNITSNIVLSLVNRTDPIRLAKDTSTAWRYAKQYQMHRKELNQLKVWQATGQYNRQMLSRIAELEDAIHRNPLYEFIKAGMMPTMVMDTSTKEDLYEYQPKYIEWLNNKWGKVPTPVRKAAEFMTVARGTTLHNVLLDATQLSDFVFRYAVYQQEIRKGTSKEAAMKKARDMFINFDLPTSRTLQLLNDSGLWMYTKFFLRIQKVLHDQIRNNPVSFFAVPMVTSLLGLPGLIPVLMLHRILSGYGFFNIPINDVLTMLSLALPMRLVGF